MMPIEDGQRIVPPVEQTDLCEWCNTPLISHRPLSLSHHAFLVGSQVDRLNAASREWALVTAAAAPPAGGNSSKDRGGIRSRTWSATGSPGSVCRRLKRRRYASTYRAFRSTSGMGGFKMSGSSRSWIGEDDIIGLAARIPADQHNGPIHDAFCPICRKP